MFMMSRSGGRRLITVPLSMITPNPNQPRRVFDAEELMGLAESIKRNGILQPVTVRQTSDGKYEIIAGERRCRAAAMAGLKAVPCIVTEVDDKRSAILSLMENLQRSDLNCFEEADGIARLINSWGITQQEVAERLGKAQSTIANKLRLLRLTPAQRRRIIDAGLTERHARALLRILDDAQRDSALDSIINKGLNVSDTDKLIDEILSPKQEPAPAAVASKRTPIVRDLRLFINTISKAVDTMNQSGLNARTAKSETDEYIEYRVIIPKVGQKIS